MIITTQQNEIVIIVSIENAASIPAPKYKMLIRKTFWSHQQSATKKANANGKIWFIKPPIEKTYSSAKIKMYFRKFKNCKPFFVSKNSFIKTPTTKV